MASGISKLAEPESAEYIQLVLVTTFFVGETVFDGYVQAGLFNEFPLQARAQRIYIGRSSYHRIQSGPETSWELKFKTVNIFIRLSDR